MNTRHLLSALRDAIPLLNSYRQFAADNYIQEEVPGTAENVYAKAQVALAIAEGTIATPAIEPVPEGTPESDAALKTCGPNGGLLVIVDFARRLETERNAALRRIKELEDEIQHLHETWGDA